MIKVRFFSLIREAIDCEELDLDYASEWVTVNDLKKSLIDEGGSVWREALMQPNVVHALNQRVVDPTHPISEGDEIAFFPPMTGG